MISSGYSFPKNPPIKYYGLTIELDTDLFNEKMGHDRSLIDCYERGRVNHYIAEILMTMGQKEQRDLINHVASASKLENKYVGEITMFYGKLCCVVDGRDQQRQQLLLQEQEQEQDQPLWSGRVKLYLFVGIRHHWEEDFSTMYYPQDGDGSNLNPYEIFLPNDWKISIHIDENDTTLEKLLRRPTREFAIAYKQNECRTTTKVYVPGVTAKTQAVLKRGAQNLRRRKARKAQIQLLEQRYRPPLSTQELRYRQKQELPITDVMRYGGEGYRATESHFRTATKRLEANRQTSHRKRRPQSTKQPRQSRKPHQSRQPMVALLPTSPNRPAQRAVSPTKKRQRQKSQQSSPLRKRPKTINSALG